MENTNKCEKCGREGLTDWGECRDYNEYCR